MPLTLTCPDEAELLMLAMGEPDASAMIAHVDGCASCQATLDRLRSEVGMFRADGPEASLSPLTSPSTVSAPLPRPADASVSDEQPGATATWASPGYDGSGYPDEPLPPSIGKYLVVGRFPPSGQAEVYRVVHPQFHQERVLKLAKEPVGLDGRSEIVEEGKILSELEHPHLVRVYDLDFLGDRPYLVMEYVRGRNLEHFAAEDKVTPRRAAALVAKVASAAAFAHRRGIVHRDIKPKNILVDEAGEPRLIDFGMARLRTAWSDDRREPDGGTFAFMAPEQARVESPEDRQKVGPRSDVFALGGVLYFLLTGSAPFPGQTWREAWDRARRSDFDAGALKQIPDGLRRICLKAMAADPSDRYAAAEALQKALTRFVVGPKILVAAIGVAGLALLGGVAYALVPHRADAGRSHSSHVVTHVTLPGALAGELFVRVWTKDGRKRGLKLDEPGALPLTPGEMVHLEAKLNQPAYPYLLWLDGQGHVSVLYPRQDHKFGGSPAGEQARETLHSPEALDGGHKMKGPSGLETVLLLVRRTPLPSNIDLADSIGPLGPSPLRSELEVAVRGGDEGQPVTMLSLALHRGIDESETVKIDDPLLQLMERLQTQNQFAVIKALRFAYRGN